MIEIPNNSRNNPKLRLNDFPSTYYIIQNLTSLEISTHLHQVRVDIRITYQWNHFPKLLLQRGGLQFTNNTGSRHVLHLVLY